MRDSINPASPVVHRLAVTLIAVACGVGAPLTLAAQDGGASIPLLPFQGRLSRLAPDALTAQETFTVDSSSEIQLDITATIDNVGITITGPSSQVVDASNIAALGGQLETFEITGSSSGPFILLLTPGFHSFFVLPSLGVGEYTLDFTAPPGLAEEVAVFTDILTESKLGVALTPGEASTVIGRPISLTAIVLDDGVPITGATVEATIMPESGGTVSLPLVDNGADADFQVGDGLYSGLFTPTETGVHGVHAVVTGLTTAGVNFEREAGASFDVGPERAQILGVQDRSADDNGDSFVDRIVFDVDIDVLEAGEFKADVVLENSSGTTGFATAEAALSLGQQIISVSFSADDLRRLGENGPYEIRFVSLSFHTAEGLIPAATLYAPGQTQAYDLETLTPSAMALTAGFSDFGVDGAIATDCSRPWSSPSPRRCRPVRLTPGAPTWKRLREQKFARPGSPLCWNREHTA